MGQRLGVCGCGWFWEESGELEETDPVDMERQVVREAAGLSQSRSWRRQWHRAHKQAEGLAKAEAGAASLGTDPGRRKQRLHPWEPAQVGGGKGRTPRNRPRKVQAEAASLRTVAQEALSQWFLFRRLLCSQESEKHQCC